MATTRDDGPVLVAVGNPTHVQQLVRTAGDLAHGGPGTVRIVTVVVKSRDSPFGVFADETILRKFADDSHELVRRAKTPPGVTVERDVIVARSVARGILSAVEEADPTALVVGWQGRSRRTDALLGTTVDRLVERAAWDLYVERVGREANGVDSVLLPVAGGPHVRAAAAAARVIAERNDARVHVFSVETPGSGGGTEATAGYVAEARELLEAEADPGLRIGTETVEDGDVTDAIVAAVASGDHDVAVLGATRQGPLRGRLVGSVPRRVVDRTDATVILARDGGVVGGMFARLGGLLRR
jgi:nucleotide-binding universal stress UspA family protein